jgi:hypothetical protein
MRLIIFIVSGILLLAEGARAEIILKDCYNPNSGSRFDNNTYDFFYYKIDEKNKTLSQVWSFTEKSWNNERKFEAGSLRNAVNVYKLDYLDKNFAKGSGKTLHSNTNINLTIDLKTRIVTTQFLFDKPTIIYFQCK